MSVKGLRAGIVLYNNDAKLEIFLNDYFDVKSFTKAVEELEYKPGLLLFNQSTDQFVFLREHYWQSKLVGRLGTGHLL